MNSAGKLSTSLTELGFKVYPSQSNFVLAKVPGRNLKGIYEEMKRRDVLVRYFDTPKLQDCIRITVGTDDEISKLLKELSEILEKSGIKISLQNRN